MERLVAYIVTASHIEEQRIEPKSGCLIRCQHSSKLYIVVNNRTLLLFIYHVRTEKQTKKTLCLLPFAE